jgi:hypothetical protein
MMGFLPPLSKSHILLTHRFASLCGLLFYLYDVSRDVWVLLKVWQFQQWYGNAVLAAMMMHHVYRGTVVSVYLTHGYHAKLPRSLKIVVIIVIAPLVMFLTLVMDIWSFLNVLGMPSPAVLGVESYSKMRSLVIATCQSLPVSIIVTVIFSLGTRPSAGEYLGIRWYVLSFGGSALSMLWGLHVWLSLSRIRNEAIYRTWILIMTGGLLCPEYSGRHARALPCGLHALVGSDSKDDVVRLCMRVTVLGTVSASLVPLQRSPAVHDDELKPAKILDV